MQKWTHHPALTPGAVVGGGGSGDCARQRGSWRLWAAGRELEVVGGGEGGGGYERRG